MSLISTNSILRAHTAIVVHTCGSSKTISTLNTCYTGTVEIIDGYILDQSVSVRAVPKLIAGEAGVSPIFRQCLVLVLHISGQTMVKCIGRQCLFIVLFFFLFHYHFYFYFMFLFFFFSFFIFVFFFHFIFLISFIFLCYFS